MGSIKINSNVDGGSTTTIEGNGAMASNSSSYGLTPFGQSLSNDVLGTEYDLGDTAYTVGGSLGLGIGGSGEVTRNPDGTFDVNVSAYVGASISVDFHFDADGHLTSMTGATGLGLLAGAELELPGTSVGGEIASIFGIQVTDDGVYLGSFVEAAVGAFVAAAEYTATAGATIYNQFVPSGTINPMLPIGVDSFGGIRTYLNANLEPVETSGLGEFSNPELRNSTLEHYGIETRNADGSISADTSFGGGLRALADAIGLDGQFGIQGTFSRSGEGVTSGGSLAAGNETADSGDGGGWEFENETNDFGGTTLDGIESGSIYPLIVDLDGDGVEISFGEAVFFDWDEDGYKEQTSWAAEDDGFLVLDLNADGSRGAGDGVIDQARELAFALWGNDGDTDLQALARAFDGNNDGKLNSADAVWDELKIWQDLDQDGVTDAGELKSLGDWGISEINLTYDDGPAFSDTDDDITVFGNTLHGLASFTMNGTVRTGGVGDVSLAYNALGWREVETDLGYAIEFESGQRYDYAELDGLASANLNLAENLLDGATGDARANTLDAIYATHSVAISGGAGNDYLRGGENDDMLSGDAGADSLYGGDGNDLVFFDAQDVAVKGSYGYDVAIVATEDAVTFDLFANNFEAAYGHDGDDNLTTAGSSKNSAIYGGAGNDSITGGFGDDILAGDDGSDIINAGAGDDFVSGGQAGDTLNGQDGDDFILGGAGADKISGGNGDDFVLGGQYHDTAYGGGGDDYIDAGAGNDTAYGGKGDDNLTGGDGDDILYDGDGDDRLFGGNGDDRFYADAHNSYDIMFGGKGSDTLYLEGTAADWDWEYSETTNRVDTGRTNDNDNPIYEDVIIGTGQYTFTNAWNYIDVQDVETVVFLGGGGSVTLGQADASADNSDTFYRAADGADYSETLYAAYAGVWARGIGQDVMTGSSWADTIDGGAGSDKVSGGAGKDTITGGTGSDLLEGGDGDDKITGEAGTDLIRGAAGADRLYGGAGGDFLFGNDGDDILEGGDGSDQLAGGAGNDIITGGSGGDLLLGDAGADVLDGGLSDDQLFGGDGHDTLIGDYGNDLLVGGIGNDHLHGSAGFDALYGGEWTDQLYGGAGDDALFGGDDDDSLYGGQGRDFLEGGAGADILDGGDGSMDIASYANAQTGVSANLTAGTAGGGDAHGDSFIGIEGLEGSDFGDSLTGDKHNNTLIGRAGDDNISAGDGHDMVYGDAGHDMLYGRGGTDDLFGGDGNDVLYAGDGEPGIGTQKLVGGKGNDTYKIVAGGGDHVISEAASGGSDTVEFTNVSAANVRMKSENGNLIITWGTGSVSFTNAGRHIERFIFADGTTLSKIAADVYGSQDPRDRLYGTQGNDTVTGGHDSSILYGGDGNDLLDAGGSSGQWQYLNGGDGDDTYNYRQANGNLIIKRDAESTNGGTDTFHFDDLDFDDVTFTLESDGTADFDHSITGTTAFSASNGGWGDEQYERTLADVNGDGLIDIIAFGEHTTYVALGQTTGTFETAIVGTDSFVAEDGWGLEKYERRVADVNGDGRADIVAFGEHATYVALGKADGTFETKFTATTQFGATDGWGLEKYERRLEDVNGDGRVDIVAFGEHGIYVALGQADGKFATSILASDRFTSDAGGWGQEQFERLVGDVNGDGRADIVAFGNNSTYVALGRADGTFGVSQLGTTQFGSLDGWGDEKYERTLADVNGDGLADIVAFGEHSTYVALGQADGSFAKAYQATTQFTEENGGWGDEKFERLVGDVNGDGIADIVAFGEHATYVALGSGQAARDRLVASWTDANGVTHEVRFEDGGENIETFTFADGSSYSSDALQKIAGLVTGGAGNDTLRGATYNDIISGVGADELNGGTGADALFGGSGVDTASYQTATSGVKVYLGNPSANTGEAAGDSYSSIENLYGSNFDDVLSGNAGDNILNGGNGDDKLIGSLGADILNGGNGIDRAQYNTATSGFTADLLDRTTNTGEAAGDSYIDVENLWGSKHNDILRGDAQNNTLWGSAGADNLNGKNGNDKLYGGDGTDIIIGGYGNDDFTGGSGSDIFVFYHNNGVDRILDFEDGADIIKMGSGITYSDLSITKIGDNTQIDYGTGNAILLLAVNSTAITQDDFIFA